MPINYKEYPANWKEIRKKILQRANNKCEKCGVENHSIYVKEVPISTMQIQVSNGKFINYPVALRVIEKKVILTIAHLDHNINNNDEDNLKALCQRCHLNYDINYHKQMKRNNKDKNQIKLNYYENV